MSATMASLPTTILLLVLLESACGLRPVYNQLNSYSEGQNSKLTLTESHGVEVNFEDATNDLSPERDLLANPYLIHELMHLAHERIPPRVVHTDGAGAKGYFEVTDDVSHITNVKFFNGIGKKTPVLGRFAMSVSDVGTSETLQGNRGSAFKFYAEDGIMDLTALLNPVFAVKNPADGTSFVHILKPNPKTNLFDPNMLWDFYLHHPEAITAQLGSLSPRGRPDGYRNMLGYCIHTFQVENNKGDVSFIRLNWIPVGGLRNLTIAEGDRLAGTDQDYATADLYDAIENGDYPTYTLNMQVIPKEQVSEIPFDIFDITLYWPTEDFPMVSIGKLVLNENPDNYFHYIEMSAFNPGHLVPGIRGLDKLFQMRTFLYRTASMHRLGANFNRIKVNCPLNQVTNYDRSGGAPVETNEVDGPNYFPNFFNGPTPVNRTRAPLYKVHVKPGPTDYHYQQAAKYYHSLSDTEKQMTVDNAVISLEKTVDSIQEGVLKLFKLVDKDFAEKVKYGLSQKAVQASKTVPTPGLDNNLI